MDQSGAAPRPHSPHARLTVALASAEERQRVVEALSAPTLDHDDLWAEATRLAAERAVERAARQASLEAVVKRTAFDLEEARSAYQRLVDGRQELYEAAVWARAAAGELPGLHLEVENARDLVEHREGEQRAASTTLERVLEQRAAADAAMEEAGRELNELAGVAMDETSLRRELEASGRAVVAAEAAHARAVDELEALQREHADLDEHELELRKALTRPSANDEMSRSGLSRLIEAYQAWEHCTASGRLDPGAQALAGAWGDLQADLAEVQARQEPLLDVELLGAARMRLDAAVATAEALEASSSSDVLTAEERAAVEAAHEAVLEAEEKANRRFGAGAARERLEEARAHENAVLAAVGFASYLDVILTGGRRTNENPAREVAQRELREATLAYNTLHRSAAASPDLTYIVSERARLHSVATALLGVDPGADPVPLLRAHLEVPAEVLDELRQALAAVGCEPVGVSLPEAAAEWIEAQQTISVDQELWEARAEQAGLELEKLAERRFELEHRLAEAERAEARSAEDLELSGRSVGAFEAELTMRADEGLKRLKRVAAAEQLRTQIEALSTTLERAESDARRELDVAANATASAESDLERCIETIANIARRARDLWAQAQGDQRPEGDPLATLEDLALALEATAASSEAQVMAAAEASAVAGTRHELALEAASEAPGGADGPQPEDLRDAVVPLLDRVAGRPVVLNEVFLGLEIDFAIELLDLVAGQVAGGSVVLLTEQPALVGHAIELPAAVATVVPVAQILNSAVHGADDQQVVARLIVELGATDESTPSASPVPRWAGRR